MEKFLSYGLLLVLTGVAVTFLSSVQRFQGFSFAYRVCEYAHGLCDNNLMIAGIAVSAVSLFLMLKS